jgi:hypothetical protein
MFELNLIKDKAKARQRRRIIFMSIVSVLLLSGLLGIFCGSLFWREITMLDTKESQIASTSATINALDAQVTRDEPIARKKRNAMINAWNEDFEVRNNRKPFTPTLNAFAQYRPPNGDFWYNTIHIRSNIPVTAGGAEDPFAAAKALMGTRVLFGQGHIQIAESDYRTEQDLQQMTQDMQVIIPLVGPPNFSIDLSKKPDAAAMEGGAYVTFRVTAAATTFTGAR